MGSFFMVDDIVYSPNKYRETEGIKDINDPSAFIHVKVDEQNKKIYFMEEYVKTGMLNDEIASMIHKLGYAKEIITADSAEQKSIAEIRRLNVPRIRPARKGKDSIKQGIQYLSQFEFVVDERCVKLMEELENYTWKKDKKTDEYINEPTDSYNHAIDASRYAIEHMNNKVTVKLFKHGL